MTQSTILLLLDRLRHWFGLDGVVLSWFSSYLSHRLQSIKLGTTISLSLPVQFGVPQGSVLGPLLFILYTTPLSRIISSFPRIQHHLYADDTQIYVPLTPTNFHSNIRHLQDCLLAVEGWMHANMLKLNPDKTEFILFGTAAARSKLATLFPIDILGTKVVPERVVRNLGVAFDATLSLSQHMVKVSQSCNYHMRDLRRIRKHLDHSSAIALANALISSRLDYCNSLLYTLSQADISKLQSVQNSLCRIVTRTSRFSHITGPMKSLHWLPIRSRIIFKINLITFKALHTDTPKYLSNKLIPYTSGRNTRRSNPKNKFLTKPAYTRSFRSKRVFDKCYSTSAPFLWNKLPLNVRTSSSVESFRSGLKAYLFRIAYPP